MGVAENKAKNQAMAAQMVARGIYHGRRLTQGLSNVPKVTEQGSAAYRRRLARREGHSDAGVLHGRRLNILGRHVRQGVVSVDNDFEARAFYDSHGFARPVHQSRRRTTGKV